MSRLPGPARFPVPAAAVKESRPALEERQGAREAAEAVRERPLGFLDAARLLLDPGEHPQGALPVRQDPERLAQGRARLLRPCLLYTSRCV